MKKASLVVSRTFFNNKIFDLDNSLNRDNSLYPFYLLKQMFYEKNIELATQDINKIGDSEIVIYLEMPRKLPVNKKKSFLILFESEVIKPENWNLKFHKYFNKIFTWNDDFIDNNKYIKINFPNNLIKNIDKERVKNKFCTLIAANKKSKHPLELYSERIKAINWFEKNHPNDFDLYGVGWNNYPLGKYLNYLSNKLRIVNLFFKLFVKKHISYLGKIDSKIHTLKDYKFSICYENAKNIPGYITEKIFDCFIAGVVPVYFGPKNIYNYIPSDCFIDFRKFSDYEELYKYMKNINDKERLNYLNNIEHYLASDESYQFSSEFFVKTIVDNIC